MEALWGKGCHEHEWVAFLRAFRGEQIGLEACPSMRTVELREGNPMIRNGNFLREFLGAKSTREDWNY